ncbi:hypothetical protein [Paenibacillus sp. IITD108]|uniref:hypothetical protein n=1 Tax=Paenibacillus sp. IITD108 TaxID=3116649 RepID=UPI002F40441F
MSSSPDGSKIVLLLPVDNYMGPFSNIIVLDNKGKLLLEQQSPSQDSFGQLIKNWRLSN